MVNRRQVVLGLGGALVAAGAAGTWRVLRLPDSARAPWQAITRPAPDARLDAFRHAILAPNPHNRQPWLIALEGSDAALLTCDLTRRLPQTDPFDRQITIGFGTFIELAAIGASARGFEIEVEPFPMGEPQPRLDQRPLARLRFVPKPGLAHDPLLPAIAMRRTNRLVYRALPRDRIAVLAAPGVTVSEDPTLLAELRKLAPAAILRETRTPRTHGESMALMRIGADEIDAQPDGLALSGPMIEATAMLGMTTRATLVDPTSTAYHIALDDLAQTYGSIPAALWIVSPNNSRASQIAAGRSYARATLRAAALGIAIHPMSQTLQEYPEMAELYDRMRLLLAPPPGHRVQMLARLGLADPVPPAARWPLESHLRP